MGFSSSGPFGDLERVLDRVTEQLENVEHGMRGRPRADVEDTDETFVVTVDLPGFEREDVEIEVRDDVLTIEAEHDEEQEATLEDRFVRRERRHASVARSISLPASVDESSATASYEHGVLRVELPKASPESGTRIEVE